MMIGGGSKGLFETQDKTFVLEWDKEAKDIGESKWIDTKGNEMDSSRQSCGGEMDGCIRPNGWPDSPVSSLFTCTGQCRDGKEGHGPLVPEFLDAYCTLNGNFFDKNSKKYVGKSFYLCEHKLVKDDRNGVSVHGREGKWKVVKTNKAE